MHLLSLFPSQGTASLLAPHFRVSFHISVLLLLLLKRSIKHLQTLSHTPLHTHTLLYLPDATAEGTCQTEKHQSTAFSAFQDPCAKSWVCLLLFGIKFLLLALLQEQTTGIVKFFPTTKNICSFSEFSRLPSRWPYHKASLFSEAAFSIVHHHYLLVLCRAARITGSCRASSPFSSRPGTEFKHRDLQRGLLKLLPWLFFSTPQLPVLGGNQTATRNASFCKIPSVPVTPSI